MRVIETVEAMQAEAREHIKQDLRVGFVPTMGALHQGHLSLIERAVAENDIVAVSIFVNPTQFLEGEDFAEYPRTLEDDLQQCERAGVDVVFTPPVEAMYAADRKTTVHVQGLTDTLCGITRGRGHFIGVCTVVTKLFNIVRPDVAYFGQKDAQQALVIEKMTRDLNFPVHIEICPIVREPDGLAMSSRNVRIPDSDRDSALALRRALLTGRDLIRDGERDARTVMNAMAEAVLMDPAVELDYLDIVSPDTLADVETIDDLILMAGAIRVAGVRLIDNLLVHPEGPWHD